MAISQWKNRGIPAEQVLRIYRAMRGAVTPYEMRPDLYPDPDWHPPLTDDDETEAPEEAA